MSIPDVDWVGTWSRQRERRCTVSPEAELPQRMFVPELVVGFLKDFAAKPMGDWSWVSAGAWPAWCELRSRASRKAEVLADLDVGVEGGRREHVIPVRSCLPLSPNQRCPPTIHPP
eukprot:1014974-Rhodomonas_salina.1